MSKKYFARYTPVAAGIIRKLHPDVKKRVREGIQQILADPFSGHELRFELSGFRSLRLKNYRIIYMLNEEDQSVDVYYAGRRRDVYENFQQLLLSAAKTN